MNLRLSSLHLLVVIATLTPLGSSFAADVTPKSPLSGWLIPGGSSCGSAVAVASGLADVAFGDGHRRFGSSAAACCGIVGLKTTHDLIPIDGVVPIEPEHLDTIGPLGKDIAHTVQGMDLLQSGFATHYAAVIAAKEVTCERLISLARCDALHRKHVFLA